jgi:hypothetical protein
MRRPPRRSPSAGSVVVPVSAAAARLSPRRGLRVVALALGAALGATACGPTTPSAKGPDGATTGGEGSSGVGAGAGTTGGGASGPTAGGARGPVRPSCDGTSCITCGEGLCPLGFYCEVSAKGRPPACATVAACGATPSCACLEKSAPGCSCQVREGAPFLTCGG